MDGGPSYILLTFKGYALRNGGSDNPPSPSGLRGNPLAPSATLLSPRKSRLAFVWRDNKHWGSPALMPGAYYHALGWPGRTPSPLFSPVGGLSGPLWPFFPVSKRDNKHWAFPSPGPLLIITRGQRGGVPFHSPFASSRTSFRRLFVPCDDTDTPPV